MTKLHLEFLSLKGNCTGSSESIHVEMPHCWKSHAMAYIIDQITLCSLETRSFSELGYEYISLAFGI